MTPVTPIQRELSPMHTIEVDFAGCVYVDGAYIGARLTKKETDVLRAIMTHTHVASKEHLLSVVYGGMDEPGIKVLDVFVTKLRKKLGEHREAIQTAWGRGYYRNKEYAIQRPELPQVAVHVEAAKLEALCMVTGESPDDLVQRLVGEETRRAYSEAA